MIKIFALIRSYQIQSKLIEAKEQDGGFPGAEREVWSWISVYKVQLCKMSSFTDLSYKTKPDDNNTALTLKKVRQMLEGLAV